MNVTGKLHQIVIILNNDTLKPALKQMAGTKMPKAWNEFNQEDRATNNRYGIYDADRIYCYAAKELNKMSTICAF